MNGNWDCTIIFKDDGQDFLEFDIRNRHVVESRPFQNKVWRGVQVLVAPRKGEYLVCLLQGERRAITHKIVRVIEDL